MWTRQGGRGGGIVHKMTETWCRRGVLLSYALELHRGRWGNRGGWAAMRRQRKALYRKIIRRSMYLKFFKANFRQILGRTNFVKIWCQILLNIGNNLWKKGFENSEEICTYSEILRKFKRNARKILKKVILKKFFLYFLEIILGIIM